MKKKICVITGARADYGLLFWTMQEIRKSKNFEFQLIATGMHLSTEFGLTYKVIEEDGFKIDQKVEMLLSADTPSSVAKSMGLGTIGFADAFERLAPDLVLILGDRFELLAAAQAALVARIPIAHLFGGDTTEGAYDEAIRHAITKMSHIHFATNDESRMRIIQMGENPELVFTAGGMGLDHMSRTKFLSKKELEQSLEFKFQAKNILVTYHPVTLELGASKDSFQNLLDALAKLDKNTGMIFTMPNADNDGRVIIQMIKDFCENRPNCRSYTSLGQQRYLSVMKSVDAVIGNSSSGIYEAPSFKVPTVNIGNRQKGRIQASSVVQCEETTASISKAITKAFALDCSKVVNPYGDGNACLRIVRELEKIKDFKALLQKHFYSFGNIK